MLLLTLLFGCSHSETITQVDDVSTLVFTGNYGGTEVTIDGGQHLSLDSLDSDGSGKKRAFKISPGKHRITITKGGTTVVDRIMLLTSQMATEVNVP